MDEGWATSMNGDKLLWTVQEAAEATGFSVGTIYHWISQKRIPFVRVSPRCVRFRPQDVQAWISKMVITPRS
jgi:excisionase family DNA binding protein